MKAVILAAGEGYRMHPLTCTRSKVMLPLANKPVLEHLLVEIRRAGINEVVVVIGYRGEEVRGYFDSGKQWGIEIAYRMQQKQTGTASAIETVKDTMNDNFLVMNGDIITRAEDIAALVAADRNTMGVIEVKRKRELGMVETHDDRIIRIHEKTDRPVGNKGNAGMYLFTPDIFSATSRTCKSRRGEYEITDSLQMLINEGRGVYYEEINSWCDLSYPWDLLSANELMMADMTPQNEGKVECGVVLRGCVSIGRDTLVRTGSYITGPVAIGAGCEIGPNCYIRPSTSIGDNCHIGAAVEVKNSIIMSGSRLPHHNYVGDSIIGEACNLGAGTKIANLRLDKKQISISGMDTGRRKLGAIIGDGVQIGINASINVGTVIGNNTTIGPGATTGGVVLPYSKIEGR